MRGGGGGRGVNRAPHWVGVGKGLICQTSRDLTPSSSQTCPKRRLRSSEHRAQRCLGQAQITIVIFS